MKIEKLKCVIESLLMVSDQPLTIDKICQLIDEEEVDKPSIQQALLELKNNYQDRGIELKEVASGFRFQACAEYQQWFHRLLHEKPQRYSKALLETLAIIAYRQPVTRADVEAVRGVAVSSGIMKTLQEREWIRVVGHRDVPGRPSIYATTKGFLDYFGLCSLSELPPLSEIKDISSLMEKGDEALIDLQNQLQPQKAQDTETLNNLSTQTAESVELNSLAVDAEKQSSS